MEKNCASRTGTFEPRLLFALGFYAAGALLALLSFAAAPPSQLAPAAASALPPLPPTFGHPVISGIGGNGFEPDLRLDPTNPNIIYSSAPGALSSNTSWIWKSVDGGKTFKWVAGALPFEGKVTACAGGGDTELAIDSAGHLYYNDLTFGNFSTARSDDNGQTFTCSNTGVPDAAVDRQWYAVDGDPTNGGVLYLAANENGPGGVNCPGSPAPNNVLVMYRSPFPGAVTAGIEFGPAYKITADLSCDSGLPGNNEISPVATTLGQPNGSGGFATLSAPVKHVYLIHSNAGYRQIRMGRCFPVEFGGAIPNVSDPSGLNCTDFLVADAGLGNKVGATFPSMAIDKAGNLYAVWQQAPINESDQIIGDTVLKYSYSTDEGKTWSAPIEIDTSGSPVGTLHHNVFGWVAAGDDGRINIAWYGTPGTAPIPSNGPDSCVSCDWSLWLVQSLNAHEPIPTFTAPIQASAHFIHRGTIDTFIGGRNGNRHLGDFIHLRTGPFGEAQISYADSNNLVGDVATHAMYVRQNGGEGLYAATSPVNISGIAPFNSVTDSTGDGKYEAGGTISGNMPNLDIVASSVSKITTAPCSPGAPCYRVVMQLNNLSLDPDLANDPDPDLVWLTQWLVPSTSDPKGGKNFFVYAESTSGGAMQCFAGENHAIRNSDWFILTYPGQTALPAANCVVVQGANGTITIDVPLSLVNEVNPIDDQLHEVTASTMTLAVPANSANAIIGSYYGVHFNVIDVAQPFVFDPTPGPVPLSAVVSRKTHGDAGTFDVNLPLTGGPGIECRSGGANSDYTLVFTFVDQLASVDTASVTSGSVSASNIGTDRHQYIVNLTGVANARVITVSLSNVVDIAGHQSATVSVPMGVLVGDANFNKVVSNTDVAAVKGQISSPVITSNFRTDVNANGIVSNTDVSATKAQVSTTLP